MAEQLLVRRLVWPILPRQQCGSMQSVLPLLDNRLTRVQRRLHERVVPTTRNKTTERETMASRLE